jgi:CheY-like chemotaxis protein
VARGLGGRAILVVDDDSSVRQLIARQLEQEGWRVVQAGNAADAIQLARESQPALITLDIMMPDASGWWVLEHLKEDPRTAGIPVLVVSIMEDRHKVFALGASDYLSKPYDRRQLIDRVKRLLPDLRGRRVMVVDDEPEARAMLSKILSEEGATTSEAVSGPEALALAVSLSVDLLLLDLMMPGMSGFEVVARLRANPLTSSLPVVIVTAKEITADDMRTLSGHVQRFITKGEIDPAGLAAAVRQVLGQAAPRREAAA